MGVKGLKDLELSWPCSCSFPGMSAERMMESTSSKLMNLILITCLFNNALMFSGEVAFSSLLVAKWFSVENEL